MFLGNVYTFVCRELKEESGLMVQPTDLVPTGNLEFEFTGDPVIMEVHVFTTSIYTGNPVESEGKLSTFRRIFFRC